jgi:branched-chain amino acid transport system substrate-binding protein
MGPAIRLGGLATALAIGLAACAGEGGGAGEEPSGTLTIYSSMPLQGASRLQSEAIVDGIELALRQADNRAGEFEIQYRSLDDSTAEAGSWDPGQVSANARRAAKDESTIAYIGEFNSGASAISIPILNAARVPQVSPANTLVGLTSDGPGAQKGEPDRYYPTGDRNYVRIVPKDTVQGAALARVMRAEECRTAAIVNDQEIYGAGLARNIELSAEEVGLEIVSNDGIDPGATSYRSLASRTASERPDCVVYSGITANNAVQVFKDVASALPDAKLFGSDGVAEPSFADPTRGGLPEEIGRRTLVTVATLAPDEYPPEGRRFFEDFKAQAPPEQRNLGRDRPGGTPPPSPYAIYGYEAMSLVLDAIERAGASGDDRRAVIDALFATKDRESVLGTYSIDEKGDTTLTDYGLYRIDDGELSFERTLKATPSAR